jgi:5-methyltetrahydropteroyltriglutamate--homocysteine methyltransferase
MLQINAGGYTFEAANARHEHEWKVWESVNLPEGKVISPGVVGHATNVVEHPELVADRIENFARLVGPENVIASTDCGLGGRVHEQITWVKLESLCRDRQQAIVRLGPFSTITTMGRYRLCGQAPHTNSWHAGQGDAP